MWSVTKEQKKILHTPIPDQFIQENNGRAYVNHNLVTDILNKAFGLAWSFTVVEHGIEKTLPYNKKTENIPDSYYCWVKCRIKYPVQDEKGNVIFMEREQFGGKPIVGNAEMQSDAYKAATSDALKKAASTLGVAQNIYMSPELYNALVEEEALADSWTDETLAKYKYESSIIHDFAQKVGQDTFVSIVNAFCDEVDDYTFYGAITPSNIQAFVAWLYDKEYIKEDETSATVQPEQNSVQSPKKPFSVKTFTKKKIQ